MHRLQESLFRYANGLTQGGKRMRGDHLYTMFIFLGFVMGGVISATMHAYSHDMRPLFIIVLSTYIALFEGDLAYLSPHNWEIYRNFFHVQPIDTNEKEEYIDVWEGDMGFRFTMIE